MVAVPFPLSVKVTPTGRRPDSLRAGTEYPLAVMVRLKRGTGAGRGCGIFLITGALVTVR